MITANVAFAQTTALMEEDAKILENKINHYLDHDVQDKIQKAITDRQLCCGIEIPDCLKPCTEMIADKIREHGFVAAVTHGWKNNICIGWAHINKEENN